MAVLMKSKLRYEQLSDECQDMDVGHEVAMGLQLFCALYRE